MKLSQSLVTASLAFWSLAHAAPPFDIGGIRLVSSAAQARAAISAANPELAFTDLKQQDGKIVGFDGVQKDPKSFENPDHVLALFNDEGSTWFIGRRQNFKEGTRPTIEATWAALKEKYGEPSGVGNMDPRNPLNGGRTNAAWIFDRSDKLYKDPKNRDNPCPMQMAMDFQELSGFSVPMRFNGQCGSRLNVEFLYDKNGMVSELIINAFDSAREYDALKKRQDAEEAAKKNTLDTERAKGVKPKL